MRSDAVVEAVVVGGPSNQALVVVAPLLEYYSAFGTLARFDAFTPKSMASQTNTSVS